MGRIVFFAVLMAIWSCATMLPSKVLTRRGKPKPAGVFMLLWFLGLAVITALFWVAYVKGWRAPYEGFKRVG